MAAIYIVLIVKEPIDAMKQAKLLNQLATALNNGYTYEDICTDIFKSFYKGDLQLDFNKYQNRVERNILQQGIMYYHKELKLMNTLPTITHDIDKGTITSEAVEYYLEPVASYTIDNLLNYFYSKNMADKQEYNYKRMAGIFKHMIVKYGIDKLLFMIEHASRLYDSENKLFTLSDFDSYSSIASQYLEEIKNNCKYSGGDHYVTRKRVLFG